MVIGAGAKDGFVEGRRLLEVLDQHLFTKPEDRLAFVPTGLSSFTAGDLVTGMDMKKELAQKLAYCLRHGRMIELIGMRGHEFVPRYGTDIVATRLRGLASLNQKN